MEEEKEVKVFKIDFKCPKCENGYLRPTGNILTSYSPQIPHKCSHCEYYETFSDMYYPRYEFR
jgi:hypothetical protein